MPRFLLVLSLLGLVATPAHATPPDHRLTAPTGVSATLGATTVTVRWTATADDDVTGYVVTRDGSAVSTVPATATAFEDSAPPQGATHTYTVTATGAWGKGGKHATFSPPSLPASVRVPAYKVGAAAFDISPDLIGITTTNQGGNGLGDGHLLSQLVGRGSTNDRYTERIKARAVVFDDGTNAIALATIETQGYFAAYRDELKGLADMAAAAARPNMPADHILIGADHTHSGPDTIGAWGGMPRAYFDFVYDRTVAAITSAYAQRRFADVVAGHSAAYDLIYNQSCPEAVYQSESGGPPPQGMDLPCPTGSAQGSKGTDGKDGLVRVVQATAPSGEVVVTFMAFAAHATAGGASGVHGDWPQYVGDAMAARYGGVGMAMEGAVGKTQPCRPHCAFTSRSNPSFGLSGRQQQITANYLAHVARAVDSAQPVSGPVAAAQTRIREVVTSPAVLGLFTAGGTAFGARLLRSLDPPWQNATTIGTVASALRLGDVLFAGMPGEGYPEIAFGIRDGTSGAHEVVALGLANDQIGYLIAPAAAYPVITAQVAVNDNTIFNVSPTVGDHVMCADIRLARSIGFGAGDARLAAYCAPYDAADLAGDPIGTVPVGGASIDEL